MNTSLQKRNSSGTSRVNLPFLGTLHIRIVCFAMLLVLCLQGTALAAVLRYGSQGSEVVSLQQRLSQLGYYTGEVDGNFDSDTRDAVKLFQKANGLDDDGIVGSGTQGVLNASDCVTMDEYNAALPVERGDQGEAVRIVQIQLSALGYYEGSISGTFDTATYEAVKLFQTANGIKVSGKATRDTRMLLNGGSAVTRVEYDRVRLLKSGDKGDAVKMVQTQLTELGYYTGSIDGQFGSGMAAAVKEFQTANGLSVNGKADEATRKLLNAGTGVTREEYDKVRPLQSGSKGDAVKMVQTQLTELGYYTGSIDGQFGSGMAAAVKEFQTANGLSVNGKANEATRALLNAGTGVTRAEYDKVRPLQSGSKGDAVKMVQTQLTELGYYTGSINGSFSSALVSAVKEFQTANQMSVTGKANVATRTLLNAGTGVTRAEYDKVRPLQSGSKGDAVKMVQTQLTEKGYYIGAIDGRFASGLVTAVKEFQKANGLTVSGKADVAVRTMLNAGDGIEAEEYYRVAEVKSGSPAAAVKVLQGQLTELEYYDGALDGKYSTEVKEAVKAFQRANNLKVTGTADTVTHALMESGACISGASYNLICELKPNSIGMGVKALQRRLTELGYYQDAIDGKYDSALRDKVTIFQRANGLKETGTASEETRRVMNGADAVTAAEYDKVRPLKSGDKGEAVALVQAQLGRLGYYTGAVDGKFSTALVDAVKEFQTANQMSVTGKADVAVRTLLNAGGGVTRAEYDKVRPLQSGNKGEAVTLVQTQLTELGYYTGTVDGKFGSSLVNAVKDFQSANRLTVNGKADVAVRTLLNAGGGVTRAEYDKVRPLQSGNKGEAVTLVQTQLAELGYYTGTVDGKFGSGLVTAVKEFQKANGMTVSGKADVAVRTLLNEGGSITAEEYYKVAEVKSSSPAAAIKVLQGQLTKLEYYDEALNGKYSNAVKEAVKAFQRANGLQATGTADAVTHALMESGTCVTGATYNLICELKKGSTGVAVKVLQRRLSELGYYTGDIDGEYDSGVRDAVTVFQRANGLKETGTANEETRKVMNGADAVTVEQYDRVRPLKSGDKGNAVKLLQGQLTALGYYTGTIDGRYGSGVVKAIKEFQTANELEISGKADAATRALLNSGLGMNRAEYDKICPLKYGDRSDAVAQLQTRLAQLGYYVDEIDGKYSSAVRDAVKQFQIASALTVNGEADVRVRKLMNSDEAISRAEYDANRDLVKGDWGSTVYQMQVRLNALGYSTRLPDGRFDDRTREAVRMFQQVHELNTTGVADVMTRAKIFSEDAITYEEYERNRPIKYGEESETVRAVQVKLKALGYLTGSVDGDYGSGTRKAVEIFQLAHGLEKNGEIISAEMRQMLNEGECIPASVYYWTVPLEYGDRGEAVSYLQTRLEELGYYNEAITDRYNTATQEAVMLFQLANGLDVTGKADAATRELMNSDKAVTKEQYDQGLMPDVEEWRRETIEKLIAIAQSKLGCKYVHRTQGPDTFDCSGYTSYVFGRIGIKISASSYNQGYMDLFGGTYREKLTSYSQLRRGDLLVFDTDKEDSDLSDHLGIYLGNGTFIHASSARGEVVISDLLRYGNFSWAFRLI